MQWQLLFFSMAPVVVFMIFRGDGRLRTAIGAAIAVSGVELTYNSYRLGGLEPFSLASFALFASFGGIAIRRNEELLFKLQPVALEVLLAGVFLFQSIALGIPLFAEIMLEHVKIQEVLPAYQRGYAAIYLTTLSRSVPYLLLLHAGLTAWAAFRRSTPWWFHVRVLGFYAMLAALFFAERIFDVRP